MKRILALALATTFAATVTAGNWGQFRGPNFDGSTDEINLPTKFSTTDNVAWTAEMPGPSAATPIVWGDHVFVSTTDVENKALKALALDRKTGKQLWAHDVTTGKLSQDSRSNYASPTPATDGEVVVFFYGTGDLVAYDFDGSQLWRKNIGPFAFLWTFSTSPVLYEGKLIMQICQRNTPVKGQGVDGFNDSYVLALDPKTGKELWKQVRPSKARAESLEAFSTPMPYEHKGRKQVLIAGGDCLTGHDPETGEELWRWGTWNPDRIGHWRLVPSPCAGKGVVLACAPKKAPVYAVSTDKSGTLKEDDVVWTTADDEAVTSDVPSPAFYDGDFFILSDLRRNLTRIDPTTGKVEWTVKLPGGSKYEASPMVADGKVYAVNFDGEVVIIDAKDGKQINVIPMESERTADVVRASVVASQGQLFIRGNRRLYCIGK